jgi:hypothetical protein
MGKLLKLATTTWSQGNSHPTPTSLFPNPSSRRLVNYIRFASLQDFVYGRTCAFKQVITQKTNSKLGGRVEKKKKTLFIPSFFFFFILYSKEK